MDSASSFLVPLTSIVGWCYVVFWGVFAYPQIFLNYKLKSVEGFKLDYPFLNMSGFIFYAIAYTAGYVLYELPNENYGLGKIEIQDLVFVYHGVFVNILFNLQAVFYKRGSNRVSTFSIVFTVVAWTACIFFYFASEQFGWIAPTKTINILEVMADCKVLISVTKYAPLVYWNYSRKSTEGFSSIAFMFDLAGGSFSMLHALLCFWTGETETLNIPKLSLSAVTVFYDLVLLYQHFILYGRRSKRSHSSLLSSDYSEGPSQYVKVTDDSIDSNLNL